MTINFSLSRKLENLKLDTNRKVGRAFKDIWNQLGKIGLNFLNIIPKLGRVFYEFFGDLFTDLFHGIYKQQIEPQKAKTVVIAITASFLWQDHARGRRAHSLQLHANKVHPFKSILILTLIGYGSTS